MRKFCMCVVLCLFSLSDAVQVTVYYESLCSDSVHFITKELFPNYQYFKDHLTIDFVPYGKALHTFNETTGKYTFNCQHGRDECKGNIFQACGLALADDQDTKLNFVTCVMSARNPANIYYIELCSKKYDLDFTNLTKCAISREGEALLAENGDKTWMLEPNLYYVPTVVFNNSTRINPNDQKRSLDDFKTILCSKVGNTKPEICGDTGLFGKIKHFFS